MLSMLYLSLVCTNDTMIQYISVLQSFTQISANLVEPNYVELPSELFRFYF